MIEWGEGRHRTAGKILLRAVVMRTVMRLVETYDLHEQQLLAMPHSLRTTYACNKYLLHY